MPVDHRRALGRLGEKIALDHLHARGFTLLTRNYRTRRGEIDLIAFDGFTLIFVEVKTQQLRPSQTRISLSPLAYLSARQLARYRPVALAYLNDKRFTRPTAHNIRFDAIAVRLDAMGALVDLEHIEAVA